MERLDACDLIVVVGTLYRRELFHVRRRVREVTVEEDCFTLHNHVGLLTIELDPGVVAPDEPDTLADHTGSKKSFVAVACIIAHDRTYRRVRGDR